MNAAQRRKRNRNNRLVSLGRGADSVISRAESEAAEMKAKYEQLVVEARGGFEQLTALAAKVNEMEAEQAKISEGDNKRIWKIRDLEASVEKLTNELITTHETHSKEVTELHVRRVEDAKAATDKQTKNAEELEKLRGMELDSKKLRSRLQERSEEIHKLEQENKALAKSEKELTRKVEDLTTALFVEKQKHAKPTGTSAALTVSKEA